MLPVILVCLLLCSSLAFAGEARDSKVRMQFLRSLGITRTPPGCQVDHWIPLMCGGPDSIENLRLICGEYKIRKEKIERRCKTLPHWKQQKENKCESNFCLQARLSVPCTPVEPPPAVSIP